MKEFKPEACYTKTDMYHTDITIGTAVVGNAVEFDLQSRNVIVDLGYPWKGLIPEDEVSVYMLTYAKGIRAPQQVTSIIGKQIRAIVIDIVGEYTFMLSRKASMSKAWKKLKEGTDIVGYVTNNISYGIFLDIGNGLNTYLPRNECSSTWISDTKIWFKNGDIIPVKLLSKGSNEGEKIICSRRLTDTSKVNVGGIYAVRIGNVETELKQGYFCEVTPLIPGIIDTTEKLQEGQVVRGFVKRLSKNGANLKMIN